MRGLAAQFELNEIILSLHFSFAQSVKIFFLLERNADDKDAVYCIFGHSERIPSIFQVHALLFVNSRL
jgi:hypothetical protein